MMGTDPAPGSSTAADSPLGFDKPGPVPKPRPNPSVSPFVPLTAMSKNLASEAHQEIDQNDMKVMSTMTPAALMTCLKNLGVLVYRINQARSTLRASRFEPHPVGYPTESHRSAPSSYTPVTYSHHWVAPESQGVTGGLPIISEGSQNEIPRVSPCDCLETSPSPMPQPQDNPSRASTRCQMSAYSNMSNRIFKSPKSNKP